MKITVNGKEKTFENPLTLSEMLASLKLDTRGIIIERNLEVVSRSEFDTLSIENGDNIELIRLVGGG